MKSSEKARKYKAIKITYSVQGGQSLIFSFPVLTQGNSTSADEGVKNQSSQNNVSPS